MNKFIFDMTHLYPKRYVKNGTHLYFLIRKRWFHQGYQISKINNNPLENIENLELELIADIPTFTEIRNFMIRNKLVAI